MDVDRRCVHCGEFIAADSKFCEHCGKDPASIDELLIANIYAPQLKKARIWILAVGILYLVSTALLLAILGADLDNAIVKAIVAANVALFGIHIGLWIWAKKAPFAAAVVALSLFVTIQVANAIIEPESITKGVVIKVLFIVGLAQAVSAGLQVRKLRAERGETP